jgi:hypothetical protein
MAQALPHSTLSDRARLVPVDPKVKSAKTCKISLCGVRGFDQTTKSADPSCYDAHVDQTNRRFDMERAVAVKKLVKLLGKSLGYRINDKAPTREERAAAQEASKSAVAERNALKEKRDERYRAILAADAEYQRLHAEHKAASERVDRLWSITRHYKITVGTTTSMFFHVRAEGDSWEEVIDKLQQKEGVAA